jgi:O-antigen/teichoic acid export membrane protein
MTLLTGLNGIILVPILTRSLAIADYGLYVQVVAMLNVLCIVGTLGMSNTMVRFLAATKDKEEIGE